MFIVYNPETREVTQSAEVAHADAYRDMLKEHGQSFIEVESFSRSIIEVWVTPELQLADKQRFDAPNQARIKADNQDTFRIDNLPAGTRVTVNGVDHGALEGTSLEVTSDTAAFYQIQLQAVGYYPKEVSVEAVTQ